MKAREGDRICVNSHSVSVPPRLGTVREVSGTMSTPRYLVAWDDGTESMFMPSAGSATILREPRNQAQAEPAHEAIFGCHIDVAVVEDDGESHATATLRTPRGSFTAEGRAKCHPNDPDVPLIGEELAIGRALTSLGRALTQAAGEAIEDHENRPIHLLSPA